MFRTVVVGATESEGSTRAFERALDVIRSSGGTLHIVSALDRKEPAAPYLPAEFRYTDAGASATDWLLRQLRTQAAEAAVETHPVLADPAEAIVRIATEAHADLVVVGSGSAHGHRHLGDVPKAVMDAAPCAVLVV